MRELFNLINSGIDQLRPVVTFCAQFMYEHPFIGVPLWFGAMVLLVIFAKSGKNKKQRTLFDANAVNEPYMVVLRWILIPPIVVVMKIVTEVVLLLQTTYYQIKLFFLKRKLEKYK